MGKFSQLKTKSLVLSLQEERLESMEKYCRSYGLSTDTVAILVEKGFTSLSLLALLPPHQIRYRGVPLLLRSLN